MCVCNASLPHDCTLERRQVIMVLYYTQTRRPIYSVLEKEREQNRPCVEYGNSAAHRLASHDTLRLLSFLFPPILDNLQKNNKNKNKYYLFFKKKKGIEGKQLYPVSAAKEEGERRNRYSRWRQLKAIASQHTYRTTQCALSVIYTFRCDAESKTKEIS